MRHAPTGWITTRELAKQLGRPVFPVKRMLTELNEAGQLEVRRIKKPALDGSDRPIPHYRLREPASRSRRSA
jgi:predicted ArsR family transcriptional regulator